MAVVAITSTGGPTSQASQTISGTVSNDFTGIPVITLFDNGAVIGTTKPSGTAWSLQITLPAIGNNLLVAQAADRAGNIGTSAGITFTLSSGLPPTVTETLVADSGVSASDGITFNPTLTGDGDPNATVTTSEGANTLGTTTADGAGGWRFTPSGLADGRHTLIASETNGDGTGTASLTFTLDRTAPAVVITSAGGLTNQANQTITGTVGDANLPANPTITLFDNGTSIGTTIASGGAWTLSTTLANDGVHNITAQATDLAGNTGTSNTDALRLDRTAPVVAAALVLDTGSSASDGITSNPTVTGSGDSNATVTISEGATTLGTTTANGSGAWSFTPLGLADGSHTLVASETDLNGTGTASVTFTLDRTAPTVVITSAAGLTNQPNQTIAGTVSDPNNLPANATITLFDGGSQIGTTTANGGVWATLIGLANDGAHDITARATDLAGNTGTSNTDGLTLDTSVPVVVITSPGALTNHPNQTITGTVADPANLPANPTITLLDNGNPIGTTIANGGAWSAAITLAGDGVHNITAQAIDLAANTGTSNTDVLTLDTLTPFLTEGLAFDTGMSPIDGITSNPTVAGTADPNATVTISEGPNTLGQTTTDGAGNWIFTPTGLADGVRTLVASETNAINRTGSASFTFTLKTIAPTPSGLSLSPTVNGNVTTVLTPVIVGQGEPGDTLTVFDDAGGLGTTTVGSGGAWSFTAPRLSPGVYSFRASETDIAGNLSALSAPLVVTLKTANFAKLGNFNGDLASDLLFQLQDGTLMIDNLSGNQVTAVAFPGQVGPEWQLQGVRDFGNDGTDDLLYRRSDGALQIDQIANNQIPTINMIGHIGAEWNLAGFGDFNGDGTTDVIWQRTTDQMLMVYAINNNTVTSTNLAGHIGPEWQLVSTADFNADGTTDVLWQRTTDRMLMVYDFKNNQVASTNLLGAVGPEWQIVGTGKFSSPSTPGILFARGDGTLMVDDIANNQITSSTIIGQLPAGWHLFGIGDTDGDGISDLVIRNDAGVTAVERIAGNQIASMVVAGQVGPEWRLFS